MAYINKPTRERVWKKYDCRCAYCGNPLLLKKCQVDHIDPHWHTLTEEEALRVKITKGAHEESNFNPSCKRCNRWKSTFSVEHFRREISLQCERLKRDSSAYRMALDFHMIEESIEPVKFWFEIYEENSSGRAL